MNRPGKKNLPVSGRPGRRYPRSLSVDVLRGVEEIADFLGWTARKVRYARTTGSLPIRQKNGVGVYAFKSELTAALCSWDSLPAHFEIDEEELFPVGVSVPVGATDRVDASDGDLCERAIEERLPVRVARVRDYQVVYLPKGLQFSRLEVEACRRENEIVLCEKPISIGFSPTTNAPEGRLTGVSERANQPNERVPNDKSQQNKTRNTNR